MQKSILDKLQIKGGKDCRRGENSSRKMYRQSISDISPKRKEIQNSDIPPNWNDIRSTLDMEESGDISPGGFNVARETNEKWETQRKKYLLILPCSKKKKRISNAYAIDLYDGPFYRMVRKNRPENLDILILSAKYGLIRYNEKISYYDQIMTVKRAEELANGVYVKLKEIFKKNHYDHVFINLGKTYVLALEKSKTVLSRYNVYWANGQIGERLHQLKNWLESIGAEVEGN